MPRKYQLSFALYPEKWCGDTGWAQVGAVAICTALLRGWELQAANTALALPLPKSLAGHGVNLVISLSCGHSFSIPGGKDEIRAAEGQWKANPLPRDAPIRTAARAAISPAACAAFPALPRCGKQTFTLVLSSLTENIHFADTHTLSITGNRRLYIEVGTTLPSRPGA